MAIITNHLNNTSREYSQKATFSTFSCVTALFYLFNGCTLISLVERLHTIPQYDNMKNVLGKLLPIYLRRETEKSPLPKYSQPLP